MITLLRNSLKDGGMTTIVWIAVGSMILGSALPLIMKKNSEEWALRINGTEIPYTRYAAELTMVRDYVNMLRAQYGQFAEYLLQSMGFSDPQSMTVQQLITQQLMVYGYKSQGIFIGQKEVNRKLADKKFIDESCGDLLPSFLYKENKIDNNLLKLYLQQRAITVDQLQERIQERIGTLFMQKAIGLLGHVPVLSITNAITLQGSTKDLALVRIPFEVYKKNSSMNINQNEIKEFYDQENMRAHRYYIPEQRSGTIYEFSAQGFGVSIDPREVEQYYEEHKATRYQKEPAQVTVRALGFPTRDLAETVRKSLIGDSNQLFVSLVQEYPFDNESAANNGLLKPIVRGTGDRIIEKNAFILAQDGEISPVIEHNGRFVLIERVSKTPPVVTPFVKVKNEIKEQLQQKAFKESCLRALHDLLKGNDSNAIAEFIKTYNGKSIVQKNITLADAKTDAQKSLFALENGAYTAISSGTQCFIVHLDNVVPTEVQPYDVVVDIVKNDLIEYRAKHALSQASLDFNHTIAIKGINEAAREYGLSVNKYTYKGTAEPAQATELRTKYGLDAIMLKNLEKAGTAVIVDHEGDVVIAALEEINPVVKDPAVLPEKGIMQDIINKDIKTIVAGYIASLYRDATIEKNDILALLDKENTI